MRENRIWYCLVRREKWGSFGGSNLSRILEKNTSPPPQMTTFFFCGGGGHLLYFDLFFIFSLFFFFFLILCSVSSHPLYVFSNFFFPHQFYFLSTPHIYWVVVIYMKCLSIHNFLIKI